MKTTRFTLFLGLLAFCLSFAAAPQQAGALSEMARQRMMAANPDFARAESAMDQVWEQLAQALPRPAVEPYLEDMLGWRNQGRDQAVHAVYDLFLENPSIVPVALLDEQGLPSLSAVYAKVTRERAKLMHMAAAQFKDDKKAQEIPGWIDRIGEAGASDTYYTLTPYGWVTPLYLGTERELAALPLQVRERIIKLPDNDYDTIAIVKGRLDDKLRGFNLRSGLSLEQPKGMGWVEWGSRLAIDEDAPDKEAEQ